jgi:transposase
MQDKAMLAIVRADAVCRRLMTVPSVGALVAITFTSGVDAPERFARSKGVGAHFGLTPLPPSTSTLPPIAADYASFAAP